VPDWVNTVYFQNEAGDLAALERTSAVQRRATSPLTDVVLPTMGVGGLRSNLHYYEIAGVKSPIRFPLDSKLIFVVRMPDGIDPAVFNLFPLDATKSDRRTRQNPKNRNTPLTLGLSIAPIADSTYTLVPMTGLAAGEYCFSPRTSNDGYCFGVDAPGGSDKKKR